MPAVNFSDARAMIVRRAREAADLGSRRALRDDANQVVRDLEKPTLDLKAPRRCPRADTKLTTTEQCDHGRVSSEDPDLTIERRRDDCFSLPLEEHRLR